MTEETKKSMKNVLLKIKEAEILETQLSPDELEALVAPVDCESTYMVCGGTYKSTNRPVGT